MAAALQASKLLRLSTYPPLTSPSAIRCSDTHLPVQHAPRWQSHQGFHRQQNRSSPQTDSAKLQDNPAYPAFNFADLGASRTVKLTVYAVIGILGTMETIFYTKAAWRYFRGGEQDAEVSKQPADVSAS